MRNVVIATSLVLFGGVAAADDFVVDSQDGPRASGLNTQGMFVDVGAGVQTLSPGDGNTYQAHILRFAPQATFRRHFYLGAEMDIGSFDNTPQSNTISRTSGGDSMLPAQTVTSGTTVAAKAVAGFRATAGIISGGFELASGIRYVRTQDVNGTSIGDNGALVVEARARLDVWVTHSLTVGGIVGKDLNNADNAMLGLQLGLHFDQSR
jgi:hypothetical protein